MDTVYMHACTSVRYVSRTVVSECASWHRDSARGGVGTRTVGCRSDVA
jgi:hypothetical protein